MITFKVFFLLICLSIILVECLEDCHRFGRSSSQHQCVLTPQSIDGPFYLDKNIIRQDIGEYRPGIPFKFTLYFTDANTCKPIPGLWITVWHCDGIGYYSGYTKINPSVIFETDGSHAPPTDNSTFLRGAQQTDQDGMVQFKSILPGWYANRTRHIHLKIYHKDQAMFTGQLYFTETLSDWIYGVFPYYSQKRVLNSYDYLYTDYGGVQTTFYDIKSVTKKRLTDGLLAQMVIGLNLKSTDANYG